MIDENENIDYEQMGLKHVEYRFKKYFSEHLSVLPDATVKTIMGDMADKWAVELVTRFVGQRKNIVVKYPENWWQSLKESVFPDFLLKRFPVKYEKEEVVIDKVFPDIPVDDDRLGRVFYVTKMK